MMIVVIMMAMMTMMISENKHRKVAHLYRPRHIGPTVGYTVPIHPLCLCRRCRPKAQIPLVGKVYDQVSATSLLQKSCCNLSEPVIDLSVPAFVCNMPATRRKLAQNLTQTFESRDSAQPNLL